MTHSHYDYSDSPHPIRSGLSDAYREYWQTLAEPGNWFSGAQRVAIAAEVRNALNCPFCATRKNALSPYALEGDHLSGENLDGLIVDAVHRVVTDQSRITQGYIDGNAKQGFSEEHYVELVSIVVNVFSIDNN